jgi:hypothetical protein
MSALSTIFLSRLILSIQRSGLVWYSILACRRPRLACNLSVGFSTLDLNQLFERMSQAEMLAYAERGELPQTFETAMAGRPALRAAEETESAS